MKITMPAWPGTIEYASSDGTWCNAPVECACARCPTAIATAKERDRLLGLIREYAEAYRANCALSHWSQSHSERVISAREALLAEVTP